MESKVVEFEKSLLGKVGPVELQQTSVLMESKFADLEQTLLEKGGKLQVAGALRHTLDSCARRNNLKEPNMKFGRCKMRALPLLV